MEYADQTRQREKGEMGFLQKYYHKGAFHQVCPPPMQRDMLIRWWLGGRAAQSELHGCYGECCGYEHVTEDYASPQLWQGKQKTVHSPPGKRMLTGVTIRCRGQSTPTLPIRTLLLVDGAQRLRLLLGRLGPPRLDAGTVGVQDTSADSTLILIKVADRICAKVGLLHM